MYYIQRKDNNTKQLETVDEFESFKEAKRMIIEYKTMNDKTAHYYISTRATKEYRDSRRFQKFYIA